MSRACAAWGYALEAFSLVMVVKLRGEPPRRTALSSEPSRALKKVAGKIG